MGGVFHHRQKTSLAKARVGSFMWLGKALLGVDFCTARDRISLGQDASGKHRFLSPSPWFLCRLTANSEILKSPAEYHSSPFLRNGIPCSALLVLEAPQIVLMWISVSRPREIITQSSLMIKTLWGSLKTNQIPGLPTPVDSDLVNLEWSPGIFMYYF